MADNNEVLYPIFGDISLPLPEDELLHSALNPDDYTLSETSFFGFNIPEANIDCEIYHWMHPNLGIMSGGLMIFQGKKQYTAQADYFDYRSYLPFPKGDLNDIVYPTGLHVKVHKPLKEIEINFRAPDNVAMFNLYCTAIMPAAGRADGKHFVQAMKCEGELLLRGERYRIDGYTTRDRSYGLPRSEIPHPVGPLTWGAGVFADDFAIHFVGEDSDKLSDKNLKWGYVWRDGALFQLDAMHKETYRGRDGASQTGASIILSDSGGQVHKIRATTLARMPMPFWPNMTTNLALMKYELEDGRVGYGDYQDVQFGHFLRTLPNASE